MYLFIYLILGPENWGALPLQKDILSTVTEIIDDDNIDNKLDHDHGDDYDDHDHDDSERYNDEVKVNDDDKRYINLKSTIKKKDLLTQSKNNDNNDKEDDYDDEEEENEDSYKIKAHNYNYNKNKDSNDDNLQFLDDLSTTVDNNISNIKNKFKSKTSSVSSSYN